MIKLRAEWHHKCPGCGMLLVVDLLGDLSEPLECPWCGSACEAEELAGDGDVKAYVAQAIREIEDTANGGIAVGN